MKRSTNVWRTPCCLGAAAILGASCATLAGPNLMAIGDYGQVPYRRAEPRVSLAGNELVYDFTDPEFDFGRVVARSQEPLSIVRRDLFVGFNGNGLIVDARGVGGTGGARGSNISELEIWLRIQGRVRSGRSYEWDIQASAGNNVMQGGLPAVIPAVWADGAPVGVEVTIRTPEFEDDDKIQRSVLPHGVVTLPPFERQTGGAWVVLRPSSFGNFFLLQNFSFREVESKESVAGGEMPIPIRYVPITDVVEDKAAEALTRGADAIRNARVEGTRWNGETLEDSVSITALCAAALGEINAKDEAVAKAIEWLAAQSPEPNAPWGTETVLNRLYTMARFAAFDKYRSVIAADTQFLVNAQYEDGGWSTVSPDVNPGAVVAQRTDNPRTALVGWALREARFAGAEMDVRVWRNALRYWTDAALFDGGFTVRGERYGGTSAGSTPGFTALGTAAFVGTLDMAAGFRAANCNTYLANREQLRAIGHAIDWLDKNFEEDFAVLGAGAEDPYLEPIGLQRFGEIAGIAVLNGHHHFAEGARKLLTHYDPNTSLFGVRRTPTEWATQPNLERTAIALITLGAGAAPTIVQRMIVGDDEDRRGELRGDASHLVRFLASRFGRPFLWRRAPQSADVSFLTEVPILVLSVVGRVEWPQEQWDKLRSYAFSGGTILIDIAEGQEGVRDEILSRVRSTFPEYTLRDLPADSPVVTGDTRLDPPPPVMAMSNGFREFLFVPRESWSCQWHLYDLRNARTSFDFMTNLLTYVTDGSPPRNWLSRSTYATASVPTHNMKALHRQHGGHVPAYPDLMKTMDRLMLANYRLHVADTTDPAEAHLFWITVADGTPLNDETRSALATALDAGRFVLVDVISGREAWDRNMRAQLAAIDGLTLHPLRRTDPIYTGEIPGTQGFDCVQVPLRRALHTRWTTSGRCDLHELRWKGQFAGVYSSYDLSSGVEYHYFPDCRGVMPPQARELAMNAFLSAFHRARAGGVARVP